MRRPAVSRPESKIATRRSTVDLAAVADADDEDRQLFVDYFVDDAVVAYAQSPETGEFAFEHATGRGLVGQAIDGGDQAQTIGFIDPA
jgi:hypothetical protein